MSPKLPKIIGVAGKARSGKDTIARMLIEKLGYMRVGFANPIKQLICNGLIITPIELEKYKTRPNIRRAMQRIGTVGREELGADVWVNCARLAVEKHGAGGFCVVMPDVRFQNELDAIKEWGGLAWCVRRKEGAGMLEGEEALHVSELAVDDLTGFDRVFLNDGTKEELEAEVLAMLGVETVAIEAQKKGG